MACADAGKNECNCTIAIHRDTYGNKFVSENDIIFCNPKYWIAKNDIVFAYRQD
jgi:hypothetical protein